ncbi:MAG: EamA family transporter [Fidelibacterota bacterium]|nr:MAG: EamA family transporter [Candidatus Neomarinimicrobiota bacterium]
MSPPRSSTSDTPFALATGVVLGGSLLASSAAIWIRFLPGVSPLAIGFIRTCGAAIIFFPWFWRQRIEQGLSWHDFRYSVMAGIALALHFATWITSLRYTTVANSVLFVSTHPMFVIAISLLILRIPVVRNQIVGALIALVGIIFIQWHDLDFSSSGGMFTGITLGNMLALAGGFFGAVYLLLGREARKTLSTVLHVEVTYASAAVVLLCAAIFTKVQIAPPEAEAWLFLGLLILLPTVGGHTIFNWGVHHIGAPLVALFGLLEPVESALLALIILGEGVGVTTIIGGGIILSGLSLAVWQPGVRTPVPPSHV